MYGKDGLSAELGLVEDLWRDKGHLGLLHDLTNCLRIADVSEFVGKANAVLYEVKKKNPRMGKAQMRRLEDAVHAVMNNGPLPGIGANARLVALDHPYATDLDKLHDALRLAHKHGSRGMRLGEGRALVANAPPEAALRWCDNVEQGLRSLASIKQRAIKRANMDKAFYHITGMSADLSSRSPVMAPWPIYPLPPDECAALTCDYVNFETIISVDVIANSLVSAGFQVEIPLNKTYGDWVRNEAVLWATSGGTTVTIHPRAVRALIYELLRPDVWAAGLRESLTKMPVTGEPLMVFADEAKQWAR
jgi:hypothetical protein